jgi:hypothetical protein
MDIIVDRIVHREVMKRGEKLKWREGCMEENDCESVP